MTLYISLPCFSRRYYCESVYSQKQLARSITLRHSEKSRIEATPIHITCACHLRLYSSASAVEMSVRVCTLFSSIRGYSIQHREFSSGLCAGGYFGKGICEQCPGEFRAVCLSPLSHPMISPLYELRRHSPAAWDSRILVILFSGETAETSFATMHLNILVVLYNATFSTSRNQNRESLI